MHFKNKRYHFYTLIVSSLQRKLKKMHKQLPVFTCAERTSATITSGNIQGPAQKFLDNCYKTQITSYMDMIYFYSSKYIPS
jgi:hypothetical protein